MSQEHIKSFFCHWRESSTIIRQTALWGNSSDRAMNCERKKHVSSSTKESNADEKLLQRYEGMVT